MRIAVIGLGSMGKRRIRLLRELHPEYEICGVDAREDRRREAEDAFRITCYAAISDVPARNECAFVCTSPLSHAAIIRECLCRKWNVFTELNLVDDGYAENIALAGQNERTLFLSSTFLYREETKYIRGRIDDGKKWNYVYHIGQYLPDWHPWESYRNFFVGDQRTNGCREILAIELPWLVKAFGDIERIHVETDRMTALEISYNDNCMIQITHQNGNKGCLIVDVVSPCAVRKLEAYAEGRYISWNGTPDSLMEFNPDTGAVDRVTLMEAAEHKEGYGAFIVENAYRNEIREFLDVVSGKKAPIYDFNDDRVTLSWIDAMGV